MLTPWEEGERKVAAVAGVRTRASCRRGMRARRTGSSRPCSTSSATSAPRQPSFRRSSRLWPRSSSEPDEPHVPPADPRPGLPGPQLSRHPRLLGVGARARGTASSGDGPAQPVSVGPVPDAAGRGRRASATTTSSWRSSRETTRCASSSGARTPAGRAPAPGTAGRGVRAGRAHTPGRRPRALRRHAPPRGAGGRQGRARLHERGRHSQRGLQLVADDRRRDRGKDRDQAAPLHRAPPRRISLQAARAALDGAGRRPEEIGAVIFCTCTSTRIIPSVATWISGQLGIFQTHGPSTSSRRVPASLTACPRRRGSCKRCSARCSSSASRSSPTRSAMSARPG